MKKTTLLLLSSVSCVLAGCYSTPEMDENHLKNRYEQTALGCDTEGIYQHRGFRACVEARMAYDESRKKTVTILPSDNGTLVVPRTYDDAEMMEANRVYEVVDTRGTTGIVIEEGASPNGSAAATTTTTVTVTEIEKQKTTETKTEQSNNVQATETVDAVVETDEAIEPAEEEMILELDEVVLPESVEAVQEETPAIPSVDTVEEATEEVSFGSSFDAPTMEAATEAAEMEAEPMMEPAEPAMTPMSETTASDSNAGKGLTLVVGPLKEDLVISVKSAPDAPKPASKPMMAAPVPAVPVGKKVSAVPTPNSASAASEVEKQSFPEFTMDKASEKMDEPVATVSSSIEEAVTEIVLPQAASEAPVVARPVPEKLPEAPVIQKDEKEVLPIEEK